MHTLCDLLENPLVYLLFEVEGDPPDFFADFSADCLTDECVFVSLACACPVVLQLQGDVALFVSDVQLLPMLV